jgi:hypothetical protein
MRSSACSARSVDDRRGFALPCAVRRHLWEMWTPLGVESLAIKCNGCRCVAEGRRLVAVAGIGRW